MAEQKLEKVFLIGGNDLEMQEIKNLLKKHGNEVMVIDHELSWGASLDSYLDDIKDVPKDVPVYGIELSEAGVNTDNIPANYVRIDHHNDYAGRKSSIAQVAEILDEPLTRDMQLVAANDSGYIPAMKVMGATDEEIKDIRRRDRAAQGGDGSR